MAESPTDLLIIISQVARQMKEAGLSAQEIARFTGLSEQKIEEI